jgi:predicted dehydrogenase
VAGLWGRRPERAAAVARQCGAGRAFPSYAALVDAVDAVYVATPVACHEPLAIAALEAGRHVLVEKPLCGGLACDRARLSAAAAGSAAAGGPLVSAVAYYRRLAPAWLAIRELAAGRGPLRAEVSFRAVFEPGPGDPMYWRTVGEISGGGVLADAGCHRLDILCWLLGPPVPAGAELARFFPGGAERDAAVSLAWACGSSAEVRCVWAASGPAHDRVRITGRDLEIRLPRMDAGVMSVRAGRAASRWVLPPERNPLVPVLRDFLACLAYGGEPACTLADAMLADGLIRSAASRAGGP